MDDEDLSDPRIWWDMAGEHYRTNFPPPEGHDCDERESFGDRDYHRTLTDAEAVQMTARDLARTARDRATDEAARDAFFAGLDDPRVPIRSAPTREIFTDP